jgi:hypothetical protein
VNFYVVLDGFDAIWSKYIKSTTKDNINDIHISTGLATRTCDSTGEWWVNPLTNGTWTNFTLCADRNSDNLYDVPKIIAV